MGRRLANLSPGRMPAAWGGQSLRPRVACDAVRFRTTTRLGVEPPQATRREAISQPRSRFEETAVPFDVVTPHARPARIRDAHAKSDPPVRSRRIRVATVPSDHVYVRHVDPEPADAAAVRVVRLPDPDPDEPTRSAVSRWWPPAMFEDEWVTAHREDFDVFHIQFGFDARTPAQLRRLVDSLRAAHRPLVYTVHDLRNPHHERRDEHDAQLDVLVPAADALITLTPGAASEISRRWNRDALVLPHPHVVDFERMAAVRPTPSRGASEEFRIGVHVKSLRASMDPRPVIEVLMEAIDDIPGTVLQINGHRDVLEPDGERYDRALAEFLYAAAADGRLELRVHDFLDDAALWDYLQSLDVSVLPYRFGTHSGWLEACRDLGTTVIAPACGYFADQAPVLTYRHDESGVDAASLRRAVESAILDSPAAHVSIEDRRLQRRRVADAHLELYSKLLG